MTFKWINNAIFHCFSSHHQCSSSNCTNLPLIWCPLTTTVWSTLSKSIIDWCPPPSTSFTSGAMSSLLKINQKFLSKSSWSIRGNGSNNNNSNNSGNSNSNSRGGNQRSSVPYSVNKFALSPLNQTGNHTIAPSGKVGHTFDSKRRPNVSNNGSQRGVEARLSSAYDKRQTLQYDAQSTPTRASNNSRISRANQSPHQLVINQHHFNNHSSSLKRSKGMSHSITDLRELKEKPKKHFSTNDESDEFQLEIKERRIDMYIAEIEMEPLFQLGSTIRWAFWIFICKPDPNRFVYMHYAGPAYFGFVLTVVIAWVLLHWFTYLPVISSYLLSLSTSQWVAQYSQTIQILIANTIICSLNWKHQTPAQLLWC